MIKRNAARTVDLEGTYERLSKLKGDYMFLLREVADILKVSLRTVQRRCHDGKLAYLKVERAVRVSLSALLQYIETYLVVKTVVKA